MTKFNDEADDYEVEVIRITDNAVQIMYEDDGAEIWLPRSQVEFAGVPRSGYVITVTIPNWLADEKGLLG